MVDLGEKPRVVVHKDEKNEGYHNSAIEDDDGLPAAGLDAGGQEARDEEPHQRPEKDKVSYKKPEGQEVQHGLKTSSPHKKLFTNE